MQLVILGGKLQGVEAAYLARKAGWKVVVIDRSPDPPASGLCDDFIRADIQEPKDLVPHTAHADLIIPATENKKTLDCLRHYAATSNIPVLFDFDAFAVSSSKTASNRLFAQHRIPMPLSWPACGFPVVVKPNEGSGSHGVKVFNDSEHFDVHIARLLETHVVQQFLRGPLFSIEVIGRSGSYHALQTTDLEMDSSYDCMQVKAPTNLRLEHQKTFESLARTLAESLALTGLMDVEAILHDNTLKILEIDARLPSQTPTAVWASSGVNMLEILADCFLSPDGIQKPVAVYRKGVVYEHICVQGTLLHIGGEHIMAKAGKLDLAADFFGADEALTNYHPHRRAWVATLIHIGTTRQSAWEKRNQVISGICRRFGLSLAEDERQMTDDG